MRDLADDAEFCGCEELLTVAMEDLDEFEGFARGGGFAPGCFFAGGEVGFEAGVGLREAAADDGGEFGGADLAATAAAKLHGAAAEALPGDGDGGGGGSGIAIERAERVKEFDGGGAGGEGRSRTGPLRRLKLKTMSRPRTGRPMRRRLSAGPAA
jgi:hypothetical protein